MGEGQQEDEEEDGPGTRHPGGEELPEGGGREPWRVGRRLRSLLEEFRGKLLAEFQLEEREAASSSEGV